MERAQEAGWMDDLDPQMQEYADMLELEEDELQAFVDFMRGGAAEGSAQPDDAPLCGEGPPASGSRFQPLVAVGHPLVEAVYAHIRDRGASLFQERDSNGRRIRGRLRTFWVQQHQTRKGEWEELRQKFADLPLPDRVKNVELFLVTSPPDSTPGDNEMQHHMGVIQEMLRLWQQIFASLPVDAQTRGGMPQVQRGKRPRRREYFINTCGRVLLTWIGMWGRVPGALLPKFDPATADPEYLCDLLRELPRVKDMWAMIQLDLAKFVSQLRAFRYTASMELCVDTLRKEGHLQLHVHMFIQSGCNATHPQFRVQQASSLALFGVNPHATGNVSATGQTNKARGRSANESSAATGHYYLAMPKVGKVFKHWANVEPWNGYPVRDVWITQYWQQNKLSDDAAKGEFIKCKKLVRLHTENVDLHVRLTREQTAESRRAATAAALEKMTLPNVVIPEVLAWVETRQTLRDRYQFLVLEGVSQVGKTSFARGLMGRTACLVTDCSGDNTPCLRQYDHARHRVLVFDEGKASMVLCHKKLFQASIDQVTCGSSPTNQHAYQVVVHAACIIVTSNTWSEELAKLSEADREWLSANSLHLRIFGPLWQQPGGDGCPPPYEVVGSKA